MNDNDVPDMPDRLENKKTADDYARLRELAKMSDITPCIRCLATPPGRGDPGWGAGRFHNRLAGDGMCDVYRPVLSAVVGSWPPGTKRCHWYDNKANNNVWNLRRASRSANINDCVRDGSHNLARRAHCARGNAYSPEKTGTGESGGRRCGSNSYRVRELGLRRYARRCPPFQAAR